MSSSSQVPKPEFGEKREHKKMNGVGLLLLGMLVVFLFFVILFWIIKPISTVGPNGKSMGWAIAGLALVVTLILYLLKWLFGALARTMDDGY